MTQKIFETIPRLYTKDWNKISKKRKEQVGYKCEACGVNFSLKKDCQKFLHTHHIDADKSNNIRENLKVLCIECHSKEHNHSHIKHNKQYKEWLKSPCFKIQKKQM